MGILHEAAQDRNTNVPISLIIWKVSDKILGEVKHSKVPFHPLELSKTRSPSLDVQLHGITGSPTTKTNELVLQLPSRTMVTPTIHLI